jgi:ribosomal protein S18 acetylase RimI-like enzyme
VIDLGDGARLRRATLDDLGALLTIKRALPMPSGPETTETRKGGFLLGSDEAHYAQLLRVARVWLLVLDDEVGGFSVTLDDAVLRASPLWARRDAIEWSADFGQTTSPERRVAYFDQLAVLPHLRSRYWGAALGLRALAEQIEEVGHELVLTTTVIAPINNRAAVPYLERIGARRVGQVDEHYPEVGQVVSAIYMVEAPRYHEQLACLRGDARPVTARVEQMRRLIGIIEASLAR